MVQKKYLKRHAPHPSVPGEKIAIRLRISILNDDDRNIVIRVMGLRSKSPIPERALELVGRDYDSRVVGYPMKQIRAAIKNAAS